MHSFQFSFASVLIVCNVSNLQIVGMHHWKHGRKGAGIFWLQQARDENRLNAIAEHLLGFVGKSVSDDAFQVSNVVIIYEILDQSVLYTLYHLRIKTCKVPLCMLPFNVDIIMRAA